MGAEHVHRPADRAREKTGTAGAPLPAPTAERMGAALGQEFSEVRVHTGADADRAARAAGAQAFTVGHDVVFADGGFAPDTEHGERLLAHELGHVVEQRATGPRLARQPAGQPVAPPPADRGLFVDEATRFLSGAAEYYGLSGPRGPNGKPLVRVQPAAVPGRLKDFLRIRDGASTAITAVLGGDPTRTATLRKAYADAVRTLLTAAAAASPGTTTDALYLQHQQLIHAWGWPETRLDPQRNVLLDALPATERARIRVTTDDVTLGGIATLFGPNPPVRPLPPDTTVTLAPTIPAAQRTGLATLARYLITDAPPLLAPNRSTTLRLDLTAQGGGRGTYRFTEVQRPGPPVLREVLVEHLATLGPERDQSRQQPGGAALFARHRFVRDTATWTDDGQFAQLLGALATVPDGVLARIEQIRFVRVASLPKGHDAEYSLADHTVSVADGAFQGRAGSQRAFQGPDQPASGFQRLIAHELGHAYDWAALRTAQNAAEQATAVRNTFLRQHGKPRRRGGFTIPPAQVPAFDRLRQADEAARAAVGAARGESGARFERDPRTGLNTPTDVLPPREAAAFRTAAGQDGDTRITTYADSDWREFYAESFALFLTDPETLQRLRPHLYRYFADRLPAPGRQP
ncbi:DUF4157 domain-containing protein [Kitasatospora sp. NPDC048722]|uniref:eCIS core domain-containing protein n=1 Tax=Kitasatospora sp. NPDC048722 TaxID=3155639 RepID=UPI0033FED10F